MILTIEKVKELCGKAGFGGIFNNADQNDKIIIMNYIYYTTHNIVPQVLTAQINDKEWFQKNLKIACNYFNSIQT